MVSLAAPAPLPGSCWVACLPVVVHGLFILSAFYVATGLIYPR